tara:strand:- start:5 stop:964 length:960 start_codon:yes stop_codon:yes gene_type:complete
MKIALFGGTGFVGTYIIDELIANQITPRLLIRQNSEKKLLEPTKTEYVHGDIENFEAIKETLEGCDAAIYLIALIREFPSKNLTNDRLQYLGTKRVSEACEKVGVKRFILMSALGVNEGRKTSGYMISKYKSEEVLKKSSLDWTIIRPSSLFGNPRGGGRPEFCAMLNKELLNLIPYPKSIPFPAPSFFKGINPLKSGQFSLSMIHVKDVATLFIKILKDKSSVGQTLEVGGLEKISWNTIIKTIGNVTFRKVFMLPTPFFIVEFVASLLDRFSWFPAGKEQLNDLIIGNTCDSSDILEKYNIDPIKFNDQNISYLKDC